jgi:hypothetical protein
MDKMDQLELTLMDSISRMEAILDNIKESRGALPKIPTPKTEKFREYLDFCEIFSLSPSNIESFKLFRNGGK